MLEMRSKWECPAGHGWALPLSPPGHHGDGLCTEAWGPPRDHGDGLCATARGLSGYHRDGLCTGAWGLPRDHMDGQTNSSHPAAAQTGAQKTFAGSGRRLLTPSRTRVLH